MNRVLKRWLIGVGVALSCSSSVGSISLDATRSTRRRSTGPVVLVTDLARGERVRATPGRSTTTRSRRARSDARSRSMAFAMASSTAKGSRICTFAHAHVNVNMVTHDFSATGPIHIESAGRTTSTSTPSTLRRSLGSTAISASTWTDRSSSRHRARAFTYRSFHSTCGREVCTSISLTAVSASECSSREGRVSAASLRFFEGLFRLFDQFFDLLAALVTDLLVESAPYLSLTTRPPFWPIVS